MTKAFRLLLVCLITTIAQAQTVPTVQPFGKIDVADLELKSCDFEKDANAEILFHKGDVYFDTRYNLILEIHKRIKIFNDNGKDNANIRIEYDGGDRSQIISGLQAQTINLNNGAIEITKVDKKQIFTEVIDRTRSAMVFSFPNVKPGSVIEYKYTITNDNIGNFPDWYFQNSLPTRLSQFSSNVPDILYYKSLPSIHQPYVIDKTLNSGAVVKALANVPSVPTEPFMGSVAENSERILYQLMTIRQQGEMVRNFSDTWTKVGENLSQSDYLGAQLSRKLTGEELIIAKAKALKNDDEKIAYLFNEVKNTLKWSEYYSKYSDDGIPAAWNKKVGNSGEINLILCHLLQKSGVKAYPMIVSTRKNGRVNPAYPNSYQFNSTVTYIPVDSTKLYVLDASNKFNIYNQVPNNLLNTFGFYMDKAKSNYDVVFLQNTNSIRQVISVTGEIKADGKLTGIAELNNFAYKRINAVQKYKTDGEKKYIDYLRDDDNNLKITSLKMHDIDIDTLPLKQTVNFDMDLTGSDDNYIYFSPNILSSLKNNPFLSTNRFTDIDFGYRSNYMIMGSYKLPAGYKTDALPKNVSMTMPDKSISFRRVIAEQDGSIVVRYVIDHKKSMFFKEDYPEIHEFFKKMYEMLNEQIVLKKS
jgi:hypothetical protein